MIPKTIRIIIPHTIPPNQLINPNNDSNIIYTKQLPHPLLFIFFEIFIATQQKY